MALFLPQQRASSAPHARPEIFVTAGKTVAFHQGHAISTFGKGGPSWGAKPRSNRNSNRSKTVRPACEVHAYVSHDNHPILSLRPNGMPLWDNTATRPKAVQGAFLRRGGSGSGTRLGAIGAQASGLQRSRSARSLARSASAAEDDSTVRYVATTSTHGSLLIIPATRAVRFSEEPPSELPALSPPDGRQMTSVRPMPSALPPTVQLGEPRIRHLGELGQLKL